MKFLSLKIILISCVSVCGSAFAATAAQDKLAALAAATHVKLGVYAVNTGDNQKIEYHANERFPMGCTSKVMVVAAILKKNVTDENLLKKNMTFSQEELTKAEWAPISAKHLATGMTVQDASAAAIMYSDNMAADLLLKELGGTKPVNDFARSIGDSHYQMDKWYPAEAYLTPDKRYDTTTPEAMAKSYQKLVLGDVLPTPQRELLTQWMKANTTGDHRIRAGVPAGWVVADKTGTSNYGSANDVAIIWPPHGAPIVLAVYSTQKNKDAKRHDEVLAAAARIVIEQFK